MSIAPAASATRRAIGIRVSQVKGRESESFASPGQQRDRIHAVCERDGLLLLDVMEELDVSGGRPLDARPGLSRAVAAVEPAGRCSRSTSGASRTAVPVNGFLRGDDGALEPDPATRSHHGVGSLLASRVMLGEIHFGELVNLKAHEPIVDVGVWRAVQRMKVSRGRRAKSERLLARLGTLRCGPCGARLVVGTSTTVPIRCTAARRQATAHVE